MKYYSVSQINKQITDDFTNLYKNASNFPNTSLYNECMKIINNISELKCIIFANDMGIPPVKSILTMLKRKGILVDNITGMESQCIGSLMAFLFKVVLSYQNQKDRISVKVLGVKTAALFYDVDAFEIQED